MIRRGVLITLVFVLSLAVRAGAEPPRQADIDACNEEAASAGPMPDERKAGASTQRETNASTDESAAAQHTIKGREAAATPAERQAFAACLARHGYYKGYYH